MADGQQKQGIWKIQQCRQREGEKKHWLEKMKLIQGTIRERAMLTKKKEEREKERDTLTHVCPLSTTAKTEPCRSESTALAGRDTE